MTQFTYMTQGVCTKQIDLTMNGAYIADVVFHGGCPGNLAAIRILVRGMHADQVIGMLSNVCCGNKSTSCAQQLCIALQEYKRAYL